MIGTIAAAFARSLWGRYLMIGLALLAGVSTWGTVQRREGRRLERADQSIATIKKIRRMQNAGLSVATDRRSIARRMREGRF